MGELKGEYINIKNVPILLFARIDNKLHQVLLPDEAQDDIKLCLSYYSKDTIKVHATPFCEVEIG